MKIKLNTGIIFNAVVSPNKEQAVFYNSNNNYFVVSRNDFEIIEDEAPSYSTIYTETTTTTPQQSIISLRELLGQDVKSLEFK